MMSTNFKGSNFKYGIQLDKNGDGGLTTEKWILGSRETVSYSFAAAGVGIPFWVAPQACKVISVSERHVTAAGQAGTIQVEKVPSGIAAGSGTVLLASTIDAAGTADTIQTKSALTTSAAILAAGDTLALKTASGAVTSLANATITIVVEWQ